MYRHLLIFFVVGMGTACKPSVNKSAEVADSSDKILSSFHALGAAPHTLTYQNHQPVHNEGGHIQGIQPYTYDGDAFVIVTGSSDTESYYAIIQMGEAKEVLSVNPILKKPFKHAGGFQVYQNLMAVGVEDNEARNVSKVYIYELDNPLALPEAPKKIIERTGAYERATAGCVGITPYKEQLLVMVGDWNTRHLDVYACPLKDWKSEQIQFEQLASVTTSEIPKKDWIDPDWRSYQNINLLHYQDTLYLVGLGTDGEGEDIADLFLIQETEMKDFHLKKIASQKFEKQSETSFRWSAGIAWSPEKGVERILSSTAHMQDTALFNEYLRQDTQQN